MKHARKDLLPILDWEVLRFASHGNSFPHSSIILLHLAIASRVIGGSMAHSNSFSGEEFL